MPQAPAGAGARGVWAYAPNHCRSGGQEECGRMPQTPAGAGGQEECGRMPQTPAGAARQEACGRMPQTTAGAARQEACGRMPQTTAGAGGKRRVGVCPKPLPERGGKRSVGACPKPRPGEEEQDKVRSQSPNPCRAKKGGIPQTPSRTKGQDECWRIPHTPVCVETQKV